MTALTLTIRLSERGPVEIDPMQWPAIADKSMWPDGHSAVNLTVRRHADGRVLVYGNFGHKAGGFLLSANEATPEGIARAVRRTAGTINGGNRIADLVIGTLPAERL